MKKTLLTTAMFMSLASTAAFAHHPAADRVDPEIYAMIDENVSDTPHADMTFDDMGGAMEAASSAMEGRDDMGAMSDAAEAGMESRAGADVEMAMESRGDIDDLSNSDVAIDTMTLLEDMDRAVME